MCCCAQSRCGASEDWDYATAEVEVAGGKKQRATLRIRELVAAMPKQRPGTAAQRAARDEKEVCGCPDDDKPFTRREVKSFRGGVTKPRKRKAQEQPAEDEEQELTAQLLEQEQEVEETGGKGKGKGKKAEARTLLGGVFVSRRRHLSLL